MTDWCFNNESNIYPNTASPEVQNLNCRILTFGEVGQLFGEEPRLNASSSMIQEERNIEQDSSLLDDDSGDEQSIPDDAGDFPSSLLPNENWNENHSVSGTRAAQPYVPPASPIVRLPVVPVVPPAVRTNITTLVSQPVNREDVSVQTRRNSCVKTSRKRPRSNSNSDEEHAAKVRRSESCAPSSRKQVDVLNHMVENPALNFVVALTKIKPKKGKTSPNRNYWEIQDIAESCRSEPIIMRTGNKGKNENGSSNRILYAFYCRLPKEFTAPQFQKVSLMLRENETGKYEDKDKIKIVEIKIYQCQDVPQFFAYVKARIDLSQDSSKSRIHNIEFFYEDKLIQKSKKCKFVSGKCDLAILSNQSPSQERNWTRHFIQEFKGSN